jgi:cytochrome c-type biogenesis protein CcmH/NrfF
LFVAMLVASNRFASAATDVTHDEVSQGPTLPETRARTINQNLCCVADDADAPLALDPRVLVLERLVLADADEQAVGFIAVHYTNFDLLNLPLQLNTLALWIGPASFILISAIGFGYLHSDRRVKQPPMSLKAIEQQPLDELLSERSLA